MIALHAEHNKMKKIDYYTIINVMFFESRVFYWCCHDNDHVCDSSTTHSSTSGDSASTGEWVEPPDMASAPLGFSS